MKVRFSPRASNDLDSIYEFLIQHSPAGAARVMAAIYAAVEFVRRNPHASEMTSFHGRARKDRSSVSIQSVLSIARAR
jgi:plasmid stabilization system protein ParE